MQQCGFAAFELTRYLLEQAANFPEAFKYTSARPIDKVAAFGSLAAPATKRQRILCCFQSIARLVHAWASMPSHKRRRCLRDNAW